MTKAQNRLSSAKISIIGFAEAKTYSQMSHHWWQFLHAVKTVYNVIEKSCKSDARTVEWLASVHKLRMSDQLLKYIWEARNDDEHGLKDAIERTPGGMAYGVSLPGERASMRDQFGNTYIDNIGGAVFVSGANPNSIAPYKFASLDGKPIRNVFVPENCVLVSVTDKKGIKYDPPLEHLGNPIVDRSPLSIGRMTTKYLEDLLQEYAALRGQSKAV